MNCPIDGTQLIMTDRQGVEIDYCPQCRGVWLDRGELDKIIERSVPQSAPPPPPSGGYDRGYDDRPQKRNAAAFLMSSSTFRIRPYPAPRSHKAGHRGAYRDLRKNPD